MKCPKCGYKRQASDNQFAPATECPACGVVYSKTGSNGNAPPLATAAINKPSAVNEDTLKRARERVEMRLRKQMEANQDDERREQTLQRAKIFAADGVRQRQEEWQRQQVDKKGEPDDLTMSEAAIRVKDPSADFNAFKGGALTMFGVIRPEMAGKEAEEGEEKPIRPGRKNGYRVSLTDSLANRPPGEDLAYDTHPTNPALSDVKTPQKKVEATDASPGAYENFRAPAKEERPIQAESGRGEEKIAAQPRKELAPVAANTKTDPLEERRPAPEEADIDDSASEIEARPIEKKTPASKGEEQLEIPLHVAQSAGRRPANGLMRLLQTAAWLILVVGLVGAVLSWTTMNDVQANMAASGAIGSGSIPIALLLGFAYLATGVLGFAFFWVCTMISGQLRDIQQTLEMHAPYPNKENRPV